MKYQYALLAVMIASPEGQKRSLERDLEVVKAKDVQRMEEVEDPHRVRIEEARKKIRERHKVEQKKSLPSDSL